ncbi:MAG TPA: 4-alpha-glucanotransferase [Thermomicrobiales bacterium]|nr:4-alpha-glucanotransferase [Thermomicrobiales bacterium]
MDQIRDRQSGIICHPTSFPGPHGIGDFGEAAFRFVDWLKRGRQTLWQVLPLGPIGLGNSPYASPSAFAGNELLISLPWLAGDGLLDSSRVGDALQFPASFIEYDEVRAFKQPLLREAFDRFRRGGGSNLRPALEAFRDAQSGWLHDYATFMALKGAHDGIAWSAWPSGVALREPEALSAAEASLKDEVRYHEFIQFLFHRQWSEVRQYANNAGIRVVGDLPIFVAYDSADVWAHRELFRLDREGRPIVGAGVPPDAFTAEGQFWGNPVYDWKCNAESGYAWWIDRVRAGLQQVDILRIDHFRAFAASWVVPADAPTAAAGRWEPGPGRAIFDTMEQALGPLPLIVEDLGLITPDVVALREELGFPGMKVLQFAFDSGPANAYLPHNYVPDSVAYTGTHDNQTTIGWFRTLPDPVRASAQRYLGRDGSDIAWDLIRTAQASVSDRAIAPLQDVMRLDDDARMNTPGSAIGNWAWRYAPHQLHEGLADGLRELTDTYGRSGPIDRPRGHDPYDYTAPNTKHTLWTDERL